MWLLLVLSGRVLTRWAWLPQWPLWRQTVALIVRIHWLRLHLWVLDFCETIVAPVVARREGRWCGARWRVLCMSTPLWARRTSDRACRLVRLRVNVLR